MGELDAGALATLLGFAGGAPADGGGVAVRQRTDERRDGCIIEDLWIAGVDGDPVPAYLVRPAAAGPPRAAVLYCHAHGGRRDIGRRELLAGRPAVAGPPYGPLLAARGYVSLCLEMRTFGTRATATEAALGKALLWHGRTLAGLMLGDLARGVDVLAARPEVDAGRIAALGLSMGGIHAYWLAALDARIRAVAQLCCFAGLRELVAAGAHDLHGLWMTVPGLLAAGDTGDIAGLVAPRPQLVGVGLADPLTPEPAFAAAWARALAAYDARGCRDRLQRVAVRGGGHEETPAMRRAVLAFLDRWLAPASAAATGAAAADC